MRIKLFLLLFGLLVGHMNGLFAQEKKIKFEMGINYPIGFEKDANKENHIGFYANGIYNIDNNPFGINFKISYESYTIVMNKITKSPYNGRSLSVVPSLIYKFTTENKPVFFYAGVGSGLSVDNIEVGVFNKGYKIHFVAVPQLGIQFIKHINLSAQYYITHKDFSRFMIGIGYIF